MKNLHDCYMSHYIGQVSEERFDRILMDEDNDIHVKRCMGGMIMLDNGKIIRCINQYYKKPGDIPENVGFKSSKNKFLQCENVRKNYGMDVVGSLDCIRCHHLCLQRVKEKRLTRLRKSHAK